MIARAYEFEIFKDGDWLVAVPYDLEGGTQGEDFNDLCTMLADWLKLTLERYDIEDKKPPQPTHSDTAHCDFPTPLRVHSPTRMPQACQSNLPAQLPAQSLGVPHTVS